MRLQFSSEGWARACCAAINASDGYRRAAANWEGVVALVMTGHPAVPTRAAIVDSAGGACRTARAAGPAEVEAAGYVFEGDAEVWREVFTGRVAPAMALLTGKLKLSRGSLALLMPHVAAAREMLAAAAT